jgi:hypothetical protein
MVGDDLEAPEVERQVVALNCGAWIVPLPIPSNWNRKWEKLELAKVHGPNTWVYWGKKVNMELRCWYDHPLEDICTSVSLIPLQAYWTGNNSVPPFHNTYSSLMGQSLDPQEAFPLDVSLPGWYDQGSWPNNQCKFWPPQP